MTTSPRPSGACCRRSRSLPVRSRLERTVQAGRARQDMSQGGRGGRGGRMWGPVPGAPGDGPGRAGGDGSRAGCGRAGQVMAGPQFVQPPLQRPG